MERWVVKWPQTPIPGHTLRSGGPRGSGHRANAYGQNPICGKPELAHAIHTGVDERTVGRDKDAGNPADERPDPLLFKVPAIPAD